MSRYGVILKLISLILIILFFIAINMDNKSILDEELTVYKKMNENNTQNQEQIAIRADEEGFEANDVIVSENKSVPKTQTFAKIFGSFWIIVLAIIIGITGRILAPRRL